MTTTRGGRNRGHIHGLLHLFRVDLSTFAYRTFTITHGTGRYSIPHNPKDNQR